MDFHNLRTFSFPFEKDDMNIWSLYCKTKYIDSILRHLRIVEGLIIDDKIVDPEPHKYEISP